MDIPDRLVDFGNDDQILTANERLAKMKKKEEVRKMLSKQRLVPKNDTPALILLFSMQEMNEHDYYDGDSPYTQQRIEKVRSFPITLPCHHSFFLGS